MSLSIHAVHLRHQIDTQLELASLAPCDAIRAMHEDLEKLYRTRLVALLLAERLEHVAQAHATDAERASRRVATGAWSIALPAASFGPRPG